MLQSRADSRLVTTTACGRLSLWTLVSGSGTRLTSLLLDCESVANGGLQLACGVAGAAAVGDLFDCRGVSLGGLVGSVGADCRLVATIGGFCFGSGTK